jgi:transcriptional regulator
VYLPAAFAESNLAKIHEFVERHSFATLVTHGDRGLVASHLPLLLDRGGHSQGVLFGHMARANPQWRSIQGDALAIFSGPHAYVSPSWYAEEGTVPTWNYVAVHAYGVVETIEDQASLLEILRKSVHVYEGPRAQPWTFDESAPHVANLLKAIVGFRIVIERWEGKWKLSQNHPEHRQRLVLDALRQQPDENSQAVAALMAERFPGE